MKQNLKIEIVSDVSCPWCIIGYQSLTKALAKLAPDNTAKITWLPFELNPSMAAEGQHLGEHLQQKYGSTKEEVEQSRSMITGRGAELGFDFKFRDDGRIYNTFNAHRLLYWARKFDKQTALKLALFGLYFTEGGNPASHEDLLKAVAKAGLPSAEAIEILNSAAFATEVREEEAKHQALGIQSVPTFIINDRYKITGGQPVDTFVELLNKIAAEEASIN